MVSTNQIIGHNDVSVTVTAGPESAFLKKQFTFEEYKEQLQSYHEGKLPQPDPNNCEDPLYYKKYAHNMAPPEAYFFIPEHQEMQCKDVKTNNDRKIFYGWNNLTKFEKEGIVKMKKYVTETKGVEIPPGYDDRDIVKFA